MRDEDCPRPSTKGYRPTATKCAYSTPLGRWACMSQECPVG
jgi:hypothetical protein